MGKRGPQKTPTADLAARGSWRAKARSNEAIAVPGAPEKPVWLQGEAADEWDRQVLDLSPRKLLSKSYRASLAMFCEAWGTYVGAVIDISENGYVTVNKDGYESQRPIVAVMHKAFDRATKMGQQFGFSPSSKAGIEVEDTKEVASGKLRFFKPAS